ncbi:MAG: hypothetical protein J6P03_00130, partial [Opitutales bacterium]|nr:hypothetical protein [Opitutales bacterium]
QVEVLLNAISGEMKASDLMKAVGISDRKHFRKDYISVALKDGLIEMTIPDKPKSSNQKYRITPLGIRQISG